MVHINQWLGRTCNNIIQVFNCIIFCKKYHLKFEQVLDHDIIDKFTIDFSNNTNNVDYNLLYHAQSCNFYKGDLPFMSEFYPFPISKEEFYLILYVYILPHLKLPKNIDKLDENTLVISIRSGDIIRDDVISNGMLDLYKRNNKTILYAVPPAKMYYDIIEKHNKVIIVCENALNPVIDHLKNKYPDKITVQSNNVLDDMITLLSAQTLAGASIYNGTFFYMISCLSQNVKNMYIFELDDRTDRNVYMYLPHVHVKLIKMNDNYYDTYNLNNLITWDKEVYQLDL